MRQLAGMCFLGLVAFLLIPSSFASDRIWIGIIKEGKPGEKVQPIPDWVAAGCEGVFQGEPSFLFAKKETKPSALREGGDVVPEEGFRIEVNSVEYLESAYLVSFSIFVEELLLVSGKAELARRQPLVFVLPASDERTAIVFGVP